MKTLENIENSFVKYAELGKAFESIWSRTERKEFEQSYQKARPIFSKYLSPYLSPEKMAELDGLVNNRAKLLKLTNAQYVDLFTECMEDCNSLIVMNQTIQLSIFIKGLNAIVNFAENGGLEYSQKEDLIDLGVQILKIYPDEGYNPDDDDFFNEKVDSGKLVYGGRSEMMLAEIEVIAEENELLRRLKAGDEIESAE